ncbi:MAG: ABC transporter substrate-binding protein [Candidatus Nomurabacteria bacterium]|nr:ABC transporter substrate-binding protein [Candidatus Nomurabacteria bacterium]
MKNIFKKSGAVLSSIQKKTKKLNRHTTKHLTENFILRFENLHVVRLRVVSWFLMMAILLGLAGIQNIWMQKAYHTAAFVDGGTFIEATLGSVKTLNPLFVSTNSEKTVARLVFSQLLRYDTDGKPQYYAAKNVAISEDSKKYTVELRDNVYFHDGELLTADDVVFTINTIKDPRTRSNLSQAWKNVSIQKNSDFEVEFNLSASFSAFQGMLDFDILPEHALRDVPKESLFELTEFNLSPVGSGPFAFQSIQNTADDNTMVRLKRNNSYQFGKPMLEFFTVYAFDDKDEIIDAVKSNTVNATAELSLKESEELTNPNFIVKNTKTNGGYFIFFNTVLVPDQKMRSAIGSIINRQEVMDAVGAASPLDYPILSSQMELNLPEVNQFNLELAAETLTGLGYKLEGDEWKDAEGGNLELKVATASGSDLELAADNVVEQLESFGIRVEEAVYDVDNSGQGSLMDILGERAYDLIVYEIDLGPDPDMLPYYHSSQTGANGLNLSNYVNVTVDDILTSATATVDKKMRQTKYEAFLREWARDVPSIGLFQSSLTYITQTGVRSFSEQNRLISNIDRFSDIVHWASHKEERLKTP